MRQRGRDQAARRHAEAAAAREQIAAFHETWYDRRRAAAFLGISPRTLKQWQLDRRGPLATKMGESQQSRTFWNIDELQAFARDPAGYNAARAADR